MLILLPQQKEPIKYNNFCYEKQLLNRNTNELINLQKHTTWEDQTVVSIQSLASNQSLISSF